MQQDLDWQHVPRDDLSQCVVWLTLPSGSLKVLPASPPPQARSRRTLNQTLMGVRGFYDDHWRLEDIPTTIKDKTTTYLPARARQYTSFLHHITKGSPVPKNMLKQKEEKRQRPHTLTQGQGEQLLDACSHQRDRLLVWLLYESAMRRGEAFALFVEERDVGENRLRLSDRGVLEHGAEIKTIHAPRIIDVSSDLIDEIVDSVGRAHTAAVETNHLFLTITGARAKEAMTSEDGDALVRRVRRKTGRRHVTPHVLRHTMLTKLAELRWPPELLHIRAGHASFQHTSQTSVHPSQEALRKAWEHTQDQVRLKAFSRGEG